MRGRADEAAGLADRPPLNFVTPGHVDRLCRAVLEAGADAVTLGGDIGEAPDVVQHPEMRLQAIDRINDRRGASAVYFGPVPYDRRATENKIAFGRTRDEFK